jgi:hypothetical protein
VLLRTRHLKMARNAHAYVRGSTAKFYEWLAARDRPLDESPKVEGLGSAVYDGAVELGCLCGTRLWSARANVIGRSGDVSRKAMHAPHRIPSRRSKRTKQLATRCGTKYVATNCPRATRAARPNPGNGNDSRQNLRRGLGAQSGHDHARCGENAVRPGFGNPSRGQRDSRWGNGQPWVPQW